MKKKQVLTITGSALSLLSGITMVGYMVSAGKKKKQISPMIPLVGAAGMLAGTAMIIYPRVAAKKKKPAEEEDLLMDDEDIALIQQNINEVLGGE